jgi:CRISPR/Cas system-associated endonuclease Cas1
MVIEVITMVIEVITMVIEVITMVIEVRTSITIVITSITITQPLIIECQENNTAVIFCDERHLPYSTILPISEGNNLHQKILKQQINIQ